MPFMGRFCVSVFAGMNHCEMVLETNTCGAVRLFAQESNEAFLQSRQIEIRDDLKSWLWGTNHGCNECCSLLCVSWFGSRNVNKMLRLAPLSYCVFCGVFFLILYEVWFGCVFAVLLVLLQLENLSLRGMEAEWSRLVT
ncbi:hypothetical protein AVEN_54324-1 [Araneus ventricosus]|uniref:Uncharacterized protein n=1 Tax=Araneus ventricosus TaxID=182803 RepID=A0A4Y2HBG3_ARAVE|nr:hypothetical protein AVEN_54324-1 [Araneus ventricosus]